LQGGELQEAVAGNGIRKVGHKPATGCRLLQRHEVGKAFGGSVRVGELSFILRRVRSREAVPALNFMASRVLWLACEVHFKILV
jgi:hypothetical protein